MFETCQSVGIFVLLLYQFNGGGLLYSLNISLPQFLILLRADFIPILPHTFSSYTIGGWYISLRAKIKILFQLPWLPAVLRAQPYMFVTDIVYNCYRFVAMAYPYPCPVCHIPSRRCVNACIRGACALSSMPWYHDTSGLHIKLFSYV